MTGLDRWLEFVVQPFLHVFFLKVGRLGIVEVGTGWLELLGRIVVIGFEA